MSRVDTTAVSQPSTPVSISPAFRELPPPVIVIGMHRSGTSMVAGMLSVMGLFLDPEFPCAPEPTGEVVPDAQLRTNGYAESVAFRLLNESILMSAGANWFDVEPFLARRNRRLFARSNVARMQLATYGSLLRDHIALRPGHITGAWGWKDPRTSLILPYWLRLFPDARLLHVRRQDQGIVKSLQRRAAQQATEPSVAPSVGARASRLLRNPLLMVNAVERRLGLGSPPAASSANLQDRDFCYKLTERYVQECLAYRHLGDRYLEIWYEDVLDDPASIVPRIAAFAQLKPSQSAQQMARDLVGRDAKPNPAGKSDLLQTGLQSCKAT
jgi:hypothetical protein